MNNQAPDSWLGEIEVTHLSYEAVPLLGKPFFSEASSNGLPDTHRWECV